MIISDGTAMGLTGWIFTNPWRCFCRNTAANEMQQRPEAVEAQPSKMRQLGTGVQVRSLPTAMTTMARPSSWLTGTVGYDARLADGFASSGSEQQQGILHETVAFTLPVSIDSRDGGGMSFRALMGQETTTTYA
ncbi:hypothetical protein FALCPG4_002580 [Fusarium falciforme]